MYGKKLLCVLLALMLLLSVLPVNVLAMEQVEVYEEDYSEVNLSNAETFVGPALSDGNHADWIDRLANLPDYASDFYSWLETNATATGALADPTLGTSQDEGYVYIIDVVEGQVEFTYTDNSDKQSCAVQAVQDAAGAQYAVIRDFSFEVYGIFDRDHPEVFWLTGASKCGRKTSLSYGGTGGSGFANYTMTVYFTLKDSSFDLRAEGYQDQTVIADAIAQRDSDVERIVSGCPTGATVEEQIKYLNETLTHTNAYNSVVAGGSTSGVTGNAWECISALAGSSGAEGPVCEGYARAFKVLCDEMGIPCTLVEGDAAGSSTDIPGGHMWNYVQVDNAWYAVDVTWNDPVTGGADPVTSGYENENWLLLGSQTLVSDNWTFIQSHPVSNAIRTNGLAYPNGPVLSETDYVAPVYPENYMDISSFRSGDAFTAPTAEGKVFAGWYTDEALTQPLDKAVTEGFAYAKFLDAQTLTVKYQLTAGTTADSASTDLRLLTGVDALSYNAVSFSLTVGGTTQTVSSSTVYSKIKAGSSVIDNPSLVFGADAQYFVTYYLTGVPQSAFSSDITVAASWTTLDGTVVTGAARTFRISGSVG